MKELLLNSYINDTNDPSDPSNPSDPGDPGVPALHAGVGLPRGHVAQGARADNVAHGSASRDRERGAGGEAHGGGGAAAVAGTEGFKLRMVQWYQVVPYTGARTVTVTHSTPTAVICSDSSHSPIISCGYVLRSVQTWH